MIHQRMFRLLTAVLLTHSATADEPEEKQFYHGKPVKALLVTGGCCHDYEFQTKALTMASEAKAPIQWTVVNQGGKGTKAEIDLYQDPNWAKGYDVVVHNECFAGTTNVEYIKKITDAHKQGAPAVVIHCAMHTYRKSKDTEWQNFLGVTTKHHDHQSHYPVTTVKKDHPIMKGFPANWKTPKDELYVILDTAKGMSPLATSVSEKDGKVHPVIWVNDFHGTRVFGTTFGHTSETFSDPVFLDLVTRGILWSAGKLEK
ncbi:ThuA domain-containing protein [Verrucomicrobiaceae bacterium R5-34]|nr:ThuA domain-containing protein [Verrucomicrobiaceae bacterium R5-34]